MNDKKLAQAIYKIAHLEGTFKLRSGLESNEYFDKYRFEAQPRLLKSIAMAMRPLIPAGTDALAGLEMGGIPIATALALESGLPVVFVRKEAKGYGTNRVAEGLETLKGLRVCMVEDVITTGGQVILSAEDLRREGAIIDRVICVISRQQGGEDKLKAAGLDMAPLYTQAQLKEAAAMPAL
ncbi:MAG: orotate phosphoribosyltransferase [Bdellovibrionales bacterium]